MKKKDDQGRLIFNRREGERILIGSSIEIQLVSARSGIARIIVSAPKDLPVDRPSSEVDAKDREAQRVWKEGQNDTGWN